MPRNTVTDSVREVNEDDEVSFDPSKVYPRKFYLRFFRISKETFREMVWQGLPVIIAAPQKKPGKNQYVYGMDWIQFCRRARNTPQKE